MDLLSPTWKFASKISLAGSKSYLSARVTFEGNDEAPTVLH